MRSKTFPGQFRRALAAFVVLLTTGALLAVPPSSAGADEGGARGGTPELEVEVLVDGLSIPWDIAFTPNGTMIFTEREGRISIRRPNGRVREVTADLTDVVPSGEGGLLGLVVDPNFARNRRFFTCQYVGDSRVHVVSWTMGPRLRSAERRSRPIVSVEAGSGRHSGCRVRFGPEGALYVATGDGAVDSPNGGSNPQDLRSLAGKTLRVRPKNGKAWPGNPFIDSADRRTRKIYTYGHRNLQGLALRPCTEQMWTGEHGPGQDDEVNLLESGGNYGWDPGPGYNEGVPMTDLAKFPDAVVAKWSSGSPTVAVSGVGFVTGTGWGAWDGALAVVALKDSALRMMTFGPTGSLQGVDTPAELDGSYGRLRSPVQGPDGALYITTSNGSNDLVLRVTPAGGVGEIPAC